MSAVESISVGAAFVPSVSSSTVTISAKVSIVAAVELGSTVNIKVKVSEVPGAIGPAMLPTTSPPTSVHSAPLFAALKSKSVPVR